MPSAIALLKASAIFILPSASAYKIRACEPTTILFSPAAFIQLILSLICNLISSGEFCINFSSTSQAILSVMAKSFALLEAQTQRKGPKP